jgi:tetratricopeptide (TPR) repeat protein
LLFTRIGDVTRAGDPARSLKLVRQWVERLLVAHDDWVALGWCEYRGDDFETARAAFTEARQRVRHSTDAAVGLGYVSLRLDRADVATRHFSDALTSSPASADAAEGLRVALNRLPNGDPSAQVALEAAQSAARKRPTDTAILRARVEAEYKVGGHGEARWRSGTRPGGGAAYFARAGVDYLELKQPDGRWQSLFVAGVNVGPALPGKFPSEAPDDITTWINWLASISGLGANAVRVYTLQPPAFYQALAAHNQDAAHPRLWLLQGVWADLPQANDFDAPDYLRDFQSEIARVIDAVHGNLVLAPRRGTARGFFDADVSRYTLAWVIGREWEPFAVVAYQALRPGPCKHEGRYVTVADGLAMECWIARSLDYAADYEARAYGRLRPVTFSNWPTLDPLRHETEATRDEEDRWRQRLSGVPLPKRDAPAWDDDAVSVDAAKMKATAAFPPGVFASYHIYPNFPYFMNLEPSFAAVSDEQGVNRYAGYLSALKAHHGSQPVLVAEFGLSSSRGIAHLQPDGLHHGGLDEAEAMRQDARLLRTIRNERMAGGVAFEFMDEWFKGTWSTNPFEVPEDHRPFWFNAESPEQSYGLYAARPVAPVRLDGSATDWPGQPALIATDAVGSGWAVLRGLKALYDAGYVYVLLETAGTGPVDWSRIGFSIGLDTYAEELGERTLARPAACPTPTGVEFTVSLQGIRDSRLWVTAPYAPRHPAESGQVGRLISPAEPTGRWVVPELQTNRERYTRRGQQIAPQSIERGALRFGSLDPAAAGFDTRTDVALGEATGVIEIRLPWSLLNFADPSSGRVLHQTAPAAQMGTAQTRALRIYACARDSRTGRMSMLPREDQAALVLGLESWEEPAYVLEPKHGLDALRKAFHETAKLTKNATVPGSRGST